MYNFTAIFPNTLVCWRPKFSKICNSFHNSAVWHNFLKCLRNSGGFRHLKRPLGTPLVITHLLLEDRNVYLHRYLEILEIGRSALPIVTVQEMPWLFEIIVQLGHHQWENMKD